MIDVDEVYKEFEDALAPDAADEHYTPSTPEQFEWAIRKRTSALKEADGWKQHKDYELRLLAEKFDKRIDAAEGAAAFFDAMIARGLGAMGPDGKGRRRVTTVAGSAWIQRAQAWHWPSEEMDAYRDLVEFAREHGAVRVRESIDKAALKAIVKETGEALPGVAIEPEESVRIREA